MMTDCNTLSSNFSAVKMTLAFSNNEETRKKIVDTSQKIQEVFEGYKKNRTVSANNVNNHDIRSSSCS